MSTVSSDPGGVVGVRLRHRLWRQLVEDLEHGLLEVAGLTSGHWLRLLSSRSTFVFLTRRQRVDGDPVHATHRRGTDWSASSSRNKLRRPVQQRVAVGDPCAQLRQSAADQWRIGLRGGQNRVASPARPARPKSPWAAGAAGSVHRWPSRTRCDSRRTPHRGRSANRRQHPPVAAARRPVEIRLIRRSLCLPDSILPELARPGPEPGGKARAALIPTVRPVSDSAHPSERKRRCPKRLGTIKKPPSGELLGYAYRVRKTPEPAQTPTTTSAGSLKPHRKRPTNGASGQSR